MNTALTTLLLLVITQFFIITLQKTIFPLKTPLDKLWQEYKQKFNKTYTGLYEIRRRAAWEENLHHIHQHNEDATKGLHSYFLNINHLSDLSPSTYLQKMAKLTKSTRRNLENPEIVGSLFEVIHNLPPEFDWRELGFETPVYNQRDCGSCYAFSIALVLQGQIFKETRKLIPLSEQQLIDCSVTMGNYGCGGGSLRNTLRYLDKSGGLMAYSDYPYIAKQRRCRFEKTKALANLTSWAILPAGNENAMEIAIAKIGPIAASINASPHTFQLYHSGVYDDILCTGYAVNHAMLIVGYTKDAWILKNWWGNHWGENGYMRLKRGVNRCGISNYVAYALV